MSLSKEQKEKITRALSGYFGGVKLQCDEYLLQLESRLINRRLEIVWYVNGIFKGAWLVNDCEERRRFCRVRTKKLFSNEKVRKMKRACGKKAADELAAHSITHYSYIWPAPGALIRHLLANNKNVDLIEARII